MDYNPYEGFRIAGGIEQVYLRGRLAVDRGRRDESGQTQADFIPCVAWQKTAETIGRYVTKGQLIAVRGRIQTRRYKDREGFDRTATEVIVDEFSFAEPKRQADDGYAPAQQPVYQQPAYGTCNVATTQPTQPVAVPAWGFAELAGTGDDSELPF